MRDLQWYGKQMLEELEAIGLHNDIPNVTFVASTRMTKGWGKCTVYSRRVNGKREYTRAVIKISSFMLEDDSPEILLRNSLLHEGAHLIDKNKSGHKGRWLELAKLIGDCYGMDIQRTITTEENRLARQCDRYNQIQQKRAEAKDKWNFTCEKCGHIYRRARKPKYLTEWGYNPLDNSVYGACCGNGCKGTLIITKFPKGGLNGVKRIC